MKNEEYHHIQQERKKYPHTTYVLFISSFIWGGGEALSASSPEGVL